MMRIVPPKSPTPPVAQGERARLLEAMRAGIAYFGSLADLSHEDFVEIVEKHGGTYARYNNHGRGIAVVVVGAGGLPLTLAGDPIDTTGRMMLAESTWLELLGETAPHGPDLRLFTVDAMAELLQVPERRILAWVRAGLITPVTESHGVPRFDFAQAQIARTLLDLTESGVSTSKLRRSLEQLRSWMPDADKQLGQLLSIERCGRILIRLEAGELSDSSGQLEIDFESPDDPCQPAQLRLIPTPSSAADWYEQAIDQERAGLLVEAERSYREALLVGGLNAQTCFDLASLLARSDRKPQAIERYRVAVELDPAFADAWNNLGLLLGEAGDIDAAIAALTEAVDHAPDEMDYRFNLADTLDEAGLSEIAKAHWRQIALARGYELDRLRYARSRLAD